MSSGFEALIGHLYISNNIKRIQGSIEKLSKIYGNELVFEIPENNYILTIAGSDNEWKQNIMI